MSLRHGFVSTKTDTDDGSLFQPSQWGSSATDYDENPTHTFTGGALGSLLMRDTGDVEGASWLAAAAGVLACAGAGQAPAFRALIAGDIPALDYVSSTTSRAANRVLAGPSTGADAAPTFRALVAADIPSLDYVPSTTARAANVVLAGPTTGSDAAPTFRALVAADVPDLSSVYVPVSRTVNGQALSSNVTITASDVGLGSVENTALSTWAGSTALTTLGTIATGVWSGTAIAANKGGTGQTSYAVGDLLYAPTTSTVGKLAAVAVGQVLASAGVNTAPAYTASPTLTSINVGNTGLRAADTNATHYLAFVPGSNLTADHSLTFTTGDADRTITLSGNPTLSDWFDQSVKVAATPTFGSATLSNLTNGRVALVGASGLVTDDAGLTYNPSTDQLSVGVPEATVTSAPVLGVYAAGSAWIVARDTTNNQEFFAGANSGSVWVGSGTSVPLYIGINNAEKWQFTTAGNLSGVSGSRTIFGSDAANGDLTLEGTSHATKTTSDVAIQPNGGTVSIGGTACVAAFGPAAPASITVKHGLIVAIS